MDLDSIEVYRSMGFTHAVVVRSTDPGQPDGYKPVRKHPTSGKFVDENGVEHDTAEPFPKPKKSDAKSQKGKLRRKTVFDK